jgi:hypothetical protein
VKSNHKTALEQNQRVMARSLTTPRKHNRDNAGKREISKQDLYPSPSQTLCHRLQQARSDIEKKRARRLGQLFADKRRISEKFQVITETLLETAKEPKTLYQHGTVLLGKGRADHLLSNNRQRRKSIDHLGASNRQRCLHCAADDIIFGDEGGTAVCGDAELAMAHPPRLV